ncbi:MAG: SDR family NAD(P)-dependent oxidoreductase [Acidimicrobiia bacterium]
MIDLGLTGKRVMVAGAGHRPPRPGIGRETAKKFAAAGARVACVDVDQGRAQAIADELTASGAEAIAVVGDLLQRTEVQRVVDNVVAAFGGIDVCVDIIGQARWNTVLDFTEEDWDWSMDVNLRQVFFIFQTVAKQMLQQGTGGSLAAVASVDGVLSAPFHVGYGAAKSGVIHIMKTFAEELGEHGIRANAVAPGAVWTEEMGQPRSDAQTKQRRPGPDDIANGLLFFSSSLAASVTGQVLCVDGGASTKGAWGWGPEHMDLVRGR